MVGVMWAKKMGRDHTRQTDFKGSIKYGSNWS